MSDDVPEIKITAPPELLDAAVRVVIAEIHNFHRYNKVGWGWTFNDRLHPGARFFVRRTQKGLSVKAMPASSKGDNRP